MCIEEFVLFYFEIGDASARDFPSLSFKLVGVDIGDELNFEGKLPSVTREAVV